MRYYFDLIDQEGIAIDEEGMELPSIESVPWCPMPARLGTPQPLIVRAMMQSGFPAPRSFRPSNAFSIATVS